MVFWVFGVLLEYFIKERVFKGKLFTALKNGKEKQNLLILIRKTLQSGTYTCLSFLQITTKYFHCRCVLYINLGDTQVLLDQLGSELVSS